MFTSKSELSSRCQIFYYRIIFKTLLGNDDDDDDNNNNNKRHDFAKAQWAVCPELLRKGIKCNNGQ